MSSVAEANLGATPVRPGYELDLDRLDGWMRANVEGYAGPLVVEQFKGGQSNPTYRLGTPGRAYVLRKQPPGQLLKGAHAMDREARVMGGVGRAGFPVPHVYGVCTDTAVLGAMFYVMSLVEGRIFWDATLPSMSRDERRAIYDAMNATIAKLHQIDYQAVGLGDYGRPSGYFQRQIARWSRQYLEDADAGRDPHMDRLVAWLPEHIPPGDDPAVVHGDYRIDNMIFHPSEPRVLAVLDWELSTLGHAGADFAYNAMMYRTPPDIVAGLAGADVSALGIPDEAEYLNAYCRRRGLPGMAHYDYYMAFCFFRLAAIMHGIKGRVLRGTASSAQAETRVRAFPELAALTWEQALKAGAG